MADRFETSPRMAQLQNLYARLEQICADNAHSDSELNAVCDEIHEVSTSIWARPVLGWTDVIERALATKYWFREQSTSPDIIAVQGLIAAVLACRHETAVNKR
jgi:hypothetical protein